MKSVWMKPQLVLPVVGLVWALGGGTSAAQGGSGQLAPPSFCADTPRQATKYANGFAAGQQKADQLFAAADVGKSPAKLRKKLQKVLDRLHEQVRDVLDSDRSEGRLCRIQGVADGFMGRLATLLGECILDGAQWAQFAASLYCELSVELGGLSESEGFVRAPNGLCGTLFENVCDSSYAYIASEGQTALTPGVQRFLTERAITLQPYPGCRTFTRAPFASVFASSLNADCAYAAP